MQRDIEQELNRVEEAQSYADRRADALEEVVRELHAKLERMAARIQSLETRLNELAESSEESPVTPDEPPEE